MRIQSFPRLALAAALAVALAPASRARAQVASPGQVIPAGDFDVYVNDQECDPANGKTMELAWQVAMGVGSLGSGVYRIYASNKSHTDKTTAGVVRCWSADDASNGISAAQVGQDVLASGGDVTVTQNVDTSDLPAAAGLACTISADTNIYVCVNYFPYVDVGVPAADPTGVATGSFILSTQKPGIPSGLTLGPGDRRLYAEWAAPSTGVNAAWYDVETTPVGSTTPVSTIRGRSTSATIGGLTNNQPYNVRVYALSAALTRGDPSAAVVGTPLAVADYWDTYRYAGGRESGGCGGAAGPLALLAAVASLARLRRRS